MFPVYPPLRSADTVHDVIERSFERYGTNPLTDADILQDLVYSDANEAASVESLLTEAMTETIRVVQLREAICDTNGWVDTPAVDAEFMARLEAFDTDISATDVDPVDLPDVRALNIGYPVQSASISFPIDKMAPIEECV